MFLLNHIFNPQKIILKTALTYLKPLKQEIKTYLKHIFHTYAIILFED